MAALKLSKCGGFPNSGSVKGRKKKKSQAFFNDSIRITNFAYNMLCPEEGPQSFSLLKQEFPQHLLWFRQFNQTKGDKLIKHTIGEKI